MKGLVILAALAASALVSAPAFAVQQTFAQTTDTIHAGETKIVSVNCPSGFFASGGGYANSVGLHQITFVTNVQYITSTQLSVPKASVYVPNLTITLNQPTTGTGDGWAVGGYALEDTAVTVYAMCIARG